MQYVVFVLIQVCQGWEQKKRRVPGLGRNHFHQPDGANNSTFWCCVASGLCMAAWYLPKSRGISTRDVLCFGEGRKPSAPAAVQQRAVGRGRNLVCRFLVWMHRHHRGSSSGTQTLESFHGYWQKRVEARARATTISAEALFNSLVSPWGPGPQQSIFGQGGEGNCAGTQTTINCTFERTEKKVWTVMALPPSGSCAA